MSLEDFFDLDEEEGLPPFERSMEEEMEEWYAEDSAGEDEDEWDDSAHWDQI